ncbi:MAG TPA: helix-turn-helix domain-containing protein [Gemmatimonadaceae bacterium]|nr:helix-turn-helix domain-containing protein [Gemmatimonadaceae bacterium]
MRNLRPFQQPQLPAPVTTVLLPAERAGVDAAGTGIYQTMHRESFEEALRDLREQRAEAVVLSVARCGARDSRVVATMIREFPRVPAVALLTALTAHSAEAVLYLGRSGVGALVDAREPAGWRRLRDLLATNRTSKISRVALAMLLVDLSAAPAQCRAFFDALFLAPSEMTTVRALCDLFDVLPSTIMSRFFRARLPAPKRYLAFARLVRAAELFENPGLSIASVANHLDYSSPQSFGRHVRGQLDITAADFRTSYNGRRMLDRFREELVLPHLNVLRTFHPFGLAGLDLANGGDVPPLVQ